MQQPLSRIYFMDSMRSVLMMLGVVLHSSLIFSPDSNWIISSENKSSLASILAYTIHLFRMPAFFVISGFFAVFLIRKYGVFRFIKHRARRIVIPLLSTAVTLNLLQAVLLDYTEWKVFRAEEFFLDRGWVSHLWFLNNLIIYLLVTALLSTLLPDYIKKNVLVMARKLLKFPFLFFIIMPLLAVVVLALNKTGFPLYSNFLGIFNVYFIMLYSPYFIFGLVLGSQRELLSQFAKVSPVLTIFLIALAVLCQQYIPQEGLAGVALMTYLEAMTEWLSVAIVFYLFNRFLNQSSATWSFFSDASYTIYLFHHILVIVFGIVLIRLEVPVLPALFLLISITAFFTLAIHRYLVSSNRIMSFLFNGK